MAVQPAGKKIGDGTMEWSEDGESLGDEACSQVGTEGSVQMPDCPRRVHGDSTHSGQPLGGMNLTTCKSGGR